MTCSRVAITLLIALCLAPLFAFAQEDVLRSTIRADIMSDPRSAEMSPTEIDALVSALAAQAEAQGVAQDYLDDQNSFDYTVEPPPYVPESTTYDALTIAVLALLIVLGAVTIFIVWQRNMRKRIPPSAGMVA